jgi:Tat protein secretion system quality control protein TatD with DNase activity
MATHEQDWEAVISISDCLSPRAIAFLGVHPWWADQITADWKANLRDQLRSKPNVHVGEIGLDKAKLVGHGEEKVRAWAQQVMVFKEQLTIAAELGRAVSVHCVRAFGELLGILKFVSLTSIDCLAFFAPKSPRKSRLDFCFYFAGIINRFHHVFLCIHTQAQLISRDHSFASNFPALAFFLVFQLASTAISTNHQRVAS